MPCRMLYPVLPKLAFVGVCPRNSAGQSIAAGKFTGGVIALYDLRGETQTEASQAAVRSSAQRAGEHRPVGFIPRASR